MHHDIQAAIVTSQCEHFAGIQGKEPLTPTGCEECLKMGGRWVHLRLCLTCGHVGCCDNSPDRHATAHFHATGHAIIRSFEPGESWGWCYVDEEMFEPMASFGVRTLAHP